MGCWSFGGVDPSRKPMTRACHFKQDQSGDACDTSLPNGAAPDSRFDAALKQGCNANGQRDFNSQHPAKVPAEGHVGVHAVFFLSAIMRSNRISSSRDTSRVVNR